MELEKIRNLERRRTGDDGEVCRRAACSGCRFQKSLGNQEGVKKLRVLKLDIARSKTVARERAIAAETTAETNPVAKNAAPAKSTRTERKAKRA